MVRTFDLIVIGAGSGLNVIPSKGKTALIDKGPMGGTCLNRGCIPSKIIIHSADVAETITNSSKFGIKSKISKINFSQITSRATRLSSHESKDIEKNIRSMKNITLFKGKAKFIGNKTIKVGNDIITANKIIIAAGARPRIPNIPGLNKIKYMTSTEALKLKKQPKVLTIIGGGYITTELAHFYGALGTKINIIGKNQLLISRADKDISKKFTEIWKKKYNLYLGYSPSKITKKGKNIIITIKNENSTKKIVSDALLFAIGVIPNSDTLNLDKTGVKLNERGFIQTNEFLETTQKNIWAFGDVVGKYMFKHSANLEGEYVAEAIKGRRIKVNYSAMPSAIFSSPQVASVGKTEQELKKGTYTVGKQQYINTGMGDAIQDKDGFVKMLIDKKTRKILGCHILGTDASILIHEVIVAMRNNLTADQLANTVHIHPALSEVVQRAIE